MIAKPYIAVMPYQYHSSDWIDVLLLSIAIAKGQFTFKDKYFDHD